MSGYFLNNTQINLLIEGYFKKVENKTLNRYKLSSFFGELKMKVKASVKADPSKGDIIVKRKGRLYVINKKDPNRKQRQKGPERKK